MPPNATGTQHTRCFLPRVTYTLAPDWHRPRHTGYSYRGVYQIGIILSIVYPSFIGRLQLFWINIEGIAMYISAQSSSVVHREQSVIHWLCRRRWRELLVGCWPQGSSRLRFYNFKKLLDEQSDDKCSLRTNERWKGMPVYMGHPVKSSLFYLSTSAQYAMSEKKEARM